MKFGAYVWNLIRKNPFAGGQYPIRVSPICTPYYPKLARTQCIFSRRVKTLLWRCLSTNYRDS